jgi:uncharacterized protein (UPF0276 family)
MATPAPLIATRNKGFGLGLRTPHYSDFLAAKQPLDWLEVITDNYLVDGGKPLQVLDRIRADYPMAMHGVAMSLGAAGGVDEAYLKRVKALADRIEPMWVSDHLCWIGPGPEQLHDLYPLPYTDEAARHVVTQIRRAQDVLQRRLVVENVSSYLAYADSAAAEWQFLAHIAEAADCLLLVDVNNIHVSSVNHGFSATDYLHGLPAHRVQQIHLAGHADHGDHLIDTHDHPVAPAVWQLYAQARQRFGAVATMIERDAEIPPLAELITELGQARAIAAEVDERPLPSAPPPVHWPAAAPALAATQRTLADHLLDRALDRPADAAALLAGPADPAERLGIYHRAYRLRLAEVLGDSFTKTRLYMGSDAFDADAQAFAVEQPPLVRSLNRYGAELPAWFARRYPGNPELQQLAQLDWDLRACFDGADVPALGLAEVQADAASAWLARPAPLHPSLVLRPVSHNVVQLWKAIDADAEVPEALPLSELATLLVWRRGLQPHFQSLDAGQAAFLRALHRGDCITTAVEGLAAQPGLAEALPAWLQEALAEGWLRAD